MGNPPSSRPGTGASAERAALVEAINAEEGRLRRDEARARVSRLRAKLVTA